MLQLYTARNSICTQKVFITFDEKKLDYEMKVINLFLNEQYSPEYLKLNPKGVVPTLVHDGRTVVESTLICEYLDDSYPDHALIPRDPYRRAKMRLWSKLIDEALFEATREISFSATFREKLREMTPEQRETRFRNVGDPERRARYMSTYEHGIDSPYVFQAIAHFEKAFKSMEAALAEGGPWLVGTDYSLADINLTPYVARLEYLNLLDLWLRERSATQAWWQRVKARNSYGVIDGRLTQDEK
ncbi:MAG: glutathione S-transferase family protein, partial [Burkholderiales bacterium]